MPATDVTETRCDASAGSSIKKSTVIGTIVAAWTPERRSANERMAVRAFATVSE
jgi:hypothetical protein